MQGRVPGGFRSLNYVEIVRDHVSQSLAWRTNRIGCHCSAKRQTKLAAVNRQPITSSLSVRAMRLISASG